MNVFIQEQEEVPNEEDCGNENGNDTNRYSTAFNWEASAA